MQRDFSDYYNTILRFSEILPSTNTDVGRVSNGQRAASALCDDVGYFTIYCTPFCIRYIAITYF